MNYRLLAKILGLLLLLEGVAMGACALFVRLDPLEADREAMFALLTAGGVTVMASLILIVAGIGKIEKVPRREAVVIVGLGWLLCGLFGGLPYVFCPPHLSLTGAVFESVSGFTTTGSTVMQDITAWPRGLLLWRAVTQWLGGLGILVLFVAVLSYLGVGSKSLFRNESSFQTGEATTARIRDTALMLWKIYLMITLLCALGLRAMGLTWFSSVAHAFTTVSTGGFSPHNESVGYYSGWGNGWLIELWLAVIMAVCSMNFLIYVVIARRAWTRLRKEEDGRWFLAVCLFAMLLIAGGIALEGGGSFWSGLRESSFTVVSIASTTGFGTADYERWPIYGQAVLAALMVVGGCSGSTAGGMKISRMLVFMKTVRLEVVRAFRPNQVFRMSVNGNPFDDKARQHTLLFIALFGTILGGSAVFVGVLEAGTDIGLDTCLASALATLSNIGPGFGDIGPTENFAHFRPGTQVFLSLLMVLGRLELFAILVLFIPAAWRKY